MSHGVRNCQVLLSFFCYLCAFLMRLDLTVAIVAMTDRTAANMDFPELDWSVKIKTRVLSSFFWGYFILQIPAGVLSRKFGPKKVLAIAMFTSSVASAFIPLFSIHLNWQAVCFVRFIQGISQGFIPPCIYTHISKWSTPEARSKIVAYVLCGQEIGSVIALITTGYLATSQFGWPSVFYVNGTFGLIWSILWLMYAKNLPSQTETITLEERTSMKNDQINSDDDDAEPPVVTNRKITEKTPWKSILCSRPVWAVLFSHVCNNWGFWTMVSLSPSYISSVFGIDIKSNGFFSAIPHLSMFIGAIIFGSLSEHFVQRKILSVNSNRKMWNSIAHWGGAISLLGIALIKDNVVAVLSLLTFALALNSAAFTGLFSNHLDLAPNYAGILMGITNCFSSVASMAAPLFAGFVIKNEKNADDWSVIFYTAAGIFFISNCSFLLFGSTKVQPWNKNY